MRCYLTSLRMAVITNNKRWQGCKERGNFVHCWKECKLVQPLWKTAWRFLRKLKIELPYDSAVPLLGIYPKKMKILIFFFFNPPLNSNFKTSTNVILPAPNSLLSPSKVIINTLLNLVYLFFFGFPLSELYVF